MLNNLLESVLEHQKKRKIIILSLVLVLLIILMIIFVLAMRDKKIEVVENDKIKKRETNKQSQQIVIARAPKVIIKDTDGDGVPDSVEELLGTNPGSMDTDRDGILDGEEIDGWKTDPLKIDTDGDKLSDYNEVKVYRTDPLNPDTDGDGYQDGEEVYNGFNPKGAGKLK